MKANAERKVCKAKKKDDDDEEDEVEIEKWKVDFIKRPLSIS